MFAGVKRDRACEESGSTEERQCSWLFKVSFGYHSLPQFFVNDHLTAFIHKKKDHDRIHMKEEL
ncbi:MAG: hypothetical protein CR997_01345 [Acidobacteria bacterium]|nr:MAG: hypothetical protein CR997_01345 [Acidobacteriota bacterium]